MVDRIRWDTVSYLPFYYVFFQFLLLTIFNLQANILTTKDILSNLGLLQAEHKYNVTAHPHGPNFPLRVFGRPSIGRKDPMTFKRMQLQ